MTKKVVFSMGLDEEELADRLRLVFEGGALLSIRNMQGEIERVIPILMDADMPSKEPGTEIQAKQVVLEV